MKEIAELRGVPLYKLITEIDAEREHTNLSSAIRIYVLNFYQEATKNDRLPFTRPRPR